MLRLYAQITVHNCSVLIGKHIYQMHYVQDTIAAMNIIPYPTTDFFDLTL